MPLPKIKNRIRCFTLTTEDQGLQGEFHAQHHLILLCRIETPSVWIQLAKSKGSSLFTLVKTSKHGKISE